MSQERWISKADCEYGYSQHDLIELIGDEGIMFCTRCRWRDFVDICIGDCKMAIDPIDVWNYNNIQRDTIYVWHKVCPTLS